MEKKRNNMKELEDQTTTEHNERFLKKIKIETTQQEEERNKIQELEKEIQELEKEIQELEKEIQELEKEIQEQQQVIQQLDEEIQKLEKEIQQLDEEIQQLDEKIQQQEQQRHHDFIFQDFLYFILNYKKSLLFLSNKDIFLKILTRHFSSVSLQIINYFLLRGITSTTQISDDAYLFANDIANVLLHSEIFKRQVQESPVLSQSLFMASIDINVEERAQHVFLFSQSSSLSSSPSISSASSSSSPSSAFSSYPLSDFANSIINNKDLGGVKGSSGLGGVKESSRYYAGSKCVSLKNMKQHKTTPKNIIRKGTKKHYRKKNKTIKK